MVRYLVAVALVMYSQLATAQLTPAAKSVLVLDADTHTVLFQKNPDDVRPIASITKLMTSVIVLDGGQSLDESITITNDDVEATRLRGGQTGTSLPVGTTLTRAELLHLALMNSQNRAAAALARSYPGGIPAFVEQMNNKAVQLDMVHTTYTDPTGLINTNVSTVDDLAKLVSAASNYAVIRDFSTSTSFQMTKYVKRHPRTIGYGTTNRLVRSGKWDLVLQKTGFINDAGHCMVMMTNIDMRRITIVFLNTPSNDVRALDAIRIRYWLEHNGEFMPEATRRTRRHHR